MAKLVQRSPISLSLTLSVSSADSLSGYYMATLDAAVHHIVHMADDYNASLATSTQSASSTTSAV
jgi:hypothetical protein